MHNGKITSAILASAIAMSVALSGCAPGSATQTPVDNGAASAKPAASPTGKTAPIRILWWGSQTRHDATQKVLGMYSAIHPEITFQPEFLAWDGYWTKVSAYAASNSMPDIMQQDREFIKTYADKKLLVPLDPFMGKDLDLSSASPLTVDGGRFSGGLFGVALGINTTCLIYDPELFKQAGAPLPTPDWTYEDYLSSATIIKQKLGIFGDGSFAPNDDAGLLYWLKQRGELLYAKDGSGLGYTNDQLVADFWAMMAKAVKDGIVAPSNIRYEVKSPEQELMVTKKAAMIGNTNSNQIVAMQKAANRPIGIAFLPNSKDQKQFGQFIKPSLFFSITSGAKDQVACAKFLSYFVNDIEANKALNAERGVPPSSKVREALLPTLTDTNKLMFAYVSDAEKRTSQIPDPSPPQHAEIIKLVQNIEDQVTTGKLTPLDGAKAFRAEAVKIFAKK